MESHFPSFNLSQGRLREELHNALMDQAVEMESAATYDLELSSIFDEAQRKNKEFVRSVREQRASRYVWFRDLSVPKLVLLGAACHTWLSHHALPWC